MSQPIVSVMSAIDNSIGDELLLAAGKSRSVAQAWFSEHPEYKARYPRYYAWSQESEVDKFFDWLSSIAED